MMQMEKEDGALDIVKAGRDIIIYV